MESKKVYEALGLARGLRQEGDLAGAEALIDAVLSQPMMQTPVTSALAAHVGWLFLERSGLREVRGELVEADGDGVRALACFEAARDRGGQAATSLALGDLSWQFGVPDRATAWWSRAEALADNTGHTPIAARALASMALAELSAGRAFEAEGMLAEAADRASAGMDAVVAQANASLHEAAAAQTDVVRVSLGLVRCIEAIRAARWVEARLLLSTSAESARALESPELYVLTLRLDAVVARRAGDPRGAVEALKLARDEAERVGLERQVALLNSELVLALADNEGWEEAFQVQQRELSASIAGQPAVHAARLEAFAVLSMYSGNAQAAERALSEAETLRIEAHDFAGSARTTALLAESLRAQGALKRAWEVADRAWEAGRRAGLLDVAAAAGLTKLQLMLTRCDPRAGALAAEVVEVASAAGTIGQQVIALDGQAAAALQMGELETAREAAAEAVALAQSQPLLRLRARALIRQAQLKLVGGDAVGALRSARDVAAVAKKAEDVEAHLRVLLVAGGALTALGRNDEGVVALSHAQTEALGAGRRGLAGEAALELANVFLRTGRHREAHQSFKEASALGREIGAKALSAKALRGLAAVAVAGGQLDDALRLLREAGEEGDPVQAAMCAVDRGRILVQRGQGQEALAAVEGLEQAGKQRLSAAEIGEVRLVRAHAMLKLGRREEAVEVLEAAVQVQRRGDERSLGAALFMLGQVEGMLGRGEACGEHLSEALVIAARLGLPEQHMIRQAIERIQRQAEGLGS